MWRKALLGGATAAFARRVSLAEEDKREEAAEENKGFDVEHMFDAVDWVRVKQAVLAEKPVPLDVVHSVPKNPYCEFCSSACGDEYISFVLVNELGKREEAEGADRAEFDEKTWTYFQDFALCLKNQPEFQDYFKSQEQEPPQTLPAESGSPKEEFQSEDVEKVLSNVPTEEAPGEKS